MHHDQSHAQKSSIGPGRIEAHESSSALQLLMISHELSFFWADHLEIDGDCKEKRIEQRLKALCGLLTAANITATKGLETVDAMICCCLRLARKPFTTITCIAAHLRRKRQQMQQMQPASHVSHSQQHKF